MKARARRTAAIRLMSMVLSQSSSEMPRKSPDRAGDAGGMHQDRRRAESPLHGIAQLVDRSGGGEDRRDGRPPRPTSRPKPAACGPRRPTYRDRGRVIITLQPASSRKRTTAKPIPEPAPVTTATRPAIPKSTASLPGPRRARRALIWRAGSPRTGGCGCRVPHPIRPDATAAVPGLAFAVKNACPPFSSMKKKKLAFGVSPGQKRRRDRPARQA